MSIASRLAAKRARIQIDAAEQRLREAEQRVLREAEQEVARVVARLTAEVRAIELPPPPAGKDGADGKDGKRGPKGEKGEKGDPPRHEWRGTSLRFEQPDGNWGRFVNLLGPAGPRGLGGGGAAAEFDPSSLPPLPAPAVQTDHVVMVRDGVAYLASVELLEEVFGGGGVVPVGAVRVNGELVRVDGQIVVVNES